MRGKGRGVRTRSRKFSDEDLLKLNSIGLSLKTMAQALGVHPTTVKSRLLDLNVSPTDTRRSFIEDVFLKLSEDQQEWVADQLGPHKTIKDFILSLIVEAFIARNHSHS